MKYQIEEISKQIKIEKTITKILKTILLALLIILLIINLMMLYQTTVKHEEIPRIGNISVFNIVSQSMTPTINVNDLIKANNLLNTTIKVGDKLLIPINTDNTYTVVSGDSLYSIAKKFGISIEELKRKNHLSSYAVSVNQVLNI